MKLRGYTFIFLILISGGCSLSSSQEKSLNRAIIQYQNAYNRHLTLLEVSLTHPCEVDFYAKDSLRLKERFNHQETRIENYNILKINQENKDVTVTLSFDYFSSQEVEKPTKKLIYACSYDNGLVWYFTTKNKHARSKCARMKYDKQQ